MSKNRDIVLSCANVSKSFGKGGNSLEILKSVSFHIKKGESAAITGSSGSGKSTLLHLLGGVDIPDSGRVEFQGQKFSGLTEAGRGKVRNRGIGLVYQFHHLLHEFSALENIAMPLLIRRMASDEAFFKAEQILDKIDLINRSDHVPAELSGGERQRIALARALVIEPVCLLADEPTGNLDQKTGKGILELMFELQKKMHLSLVIVTHDSAVSSRLDTCYELSDGLLTSR